VVKGRAQDIPAVHDQEILSVELVSELAAVDVLGMGPESVNFNGQLDGAAQIGEINKAGPAGVVGHFVLRVKMSEVAHERPPNVLDEGPLGEPEAVAQFSASLLAATLPLLFKPLLIGCLKIHGK